MSRSQTLYYWQHLKHRPQLSVATVQPNTGNVTVRRLKYDTIGEHIWSFLEAADYDHRAWFLTSVGNLCRIYDVLWKRPTLLPPLILVLVHYVLITLWLCPSLSCAWAYTLCCGQFCPSSFACSFLHIHSDRFSYHLLWNCWHLWVLKLVLWLLFCHWWMQI